MGNSTNGFALTGNLYLAVSSGGLAISTSVTFVADVGGQQLFSLSASGAMEITSAGLAASLTLTGSANVAGVFSFSGTIIFQVNTTNQQITTIGLNTVNLPAGPYFEIAIGSVSSPATLTLGSSSDGLALSGSFNLTITSSSLAITASATLGFKIGGSTVLSLTANGALLVTYGTSSFGIAAEITLGIGTQAETIAGIAFNATFVLEINTNSNPVPTINGVTVNLPGGPFFEILATGGITVGGVSISGSFLFEVSTTSVQISINASLNVFGILFSVTGFAGIFNNGTNDTGLVLYLSLSLGGSNSPTVTLIPDVLALSGSFTLEVNTTKTTYYSADNVNWVTTAPGGTYVTINANTLFKIAVSASFNLFGFSLASASFTMGYTNGVFYATGDVNFDFFGFATMNVGFYFDSGGNYWFYGTIYVQLGSDDFNIHGTLTLEFASNSVVNDPTNYTDGKYGSPPVKISDQFYLFVGGGVTAFGYDFASIGASVQISNGDVSISAYVSISFYFFSIGGTVTIDLGQISPPPAPPPPPPIGLYNSSTGVLTLNIGPGSTLPAQASQNYTITAAQDSASNGQNLWVSDPGLYSGPALYAGTSTSVTNAPGGTVEYENVTSIVVSTGNNNTSINVAGNITIPVTITSGTGTNTYVTGGGTTHITGAGGSDTIVAGSGNVTFTMAGGSAVFVGGTGHNVITNDPGNLLIVIGGTSSPEYNYYDLNGSALKFWNTGGSESTAASDTITGPATIDLESLGTGTASFSVENFNTADSLSLNGNSNSGATVSVTGSVALDLNATTIVDNGGSIALQSITSVSLTGSATGTQVTVTNSADYGTVNLGATTGSETFNVNLQSSGSYTVNVTGHSTGNTLNILGSTAGNTIDITSSAVSIGSQTVNYSVIQALNVNTAASAETVDITGTSAATTVNTGTFSDAINIGSNAESTNTGGSLSGVNSTLTINGSSSATDTLNLDNTGNSANAVATLSYNSGTGVSTLANVSGQTNLFGSSGSINFKGIQTVNLGLGNGNNTFTIQGSSAGTISITSGTGNDTYNIQALAGAVNVKTGTGTNVVNIGSLEPAVGGVIKNVKGTLTITGGGTTTMNVDDTGDTGAASGTLTPTQLTGFGMGVGIVKYSAINTLNISLGSGTNTFTITNTNSSTVTTVNGKSGTGSITLDNDADTTTINSDSGDYTINIEATGGTTNVNDASGTDTINIGSKAPSSAGIVNNIDYEVDVTGDGTDTVNVDDTGNSATKTGTLTSTVLTGLSMGTSGSVDYSGLTALNISLGGGNYTMNVKSTASGTTTTINMGAGTSIVNVTSNAPSTSGGVLTGIAGELIVVGQSANETMNVNDESNPSSGILYEKAVGAASATESSAVLTGLDLGAPVEFNSVETVNILLNNMGNTIYIQVNPSVTTLNLTGGTNQSKPNIISFGSSAQSVITTDYSNPTDATEGEQTNITGSVIAFIQGVINYTGSGIDTMIVDDSGSIAGTNGGMWTNKLEFLDSVTANPVLITFSGVGGTGSSISSMYLSLSQGANDFVVDDTFTNTSTNTAITVDFNTGITNFLIFDTHAVMTVNGGTGGGVNGVGDSFYVFGNSSVLNLNGDTGNDTFYIYASLEQNTANVGGGAGAAKVYSYRVNATVNINGGTGQTTVYLFGTVIDDTFTIYSTTTGTTVSGAGLNVNMTSVKHIVLEGLNGNNVFYIESLNIPVTIYGNGSLVLPQLTAFLNSLGLTLPDLTGGATPSNSFNDTFYVGWQGQNYIPGLISGIDALLQIFGSNGANGPDGTTVPIAGAVNTIYVDDSGDTASQTYTLTSTTMNGGGMLTGTGFGAGGYLTYDDAVNNLDFQTGNGNNSVTVDGNDTATQTSIYGGRGGNQYVVNDFNIYAWQSPVQLYGGLSVFQGNSLTVNGDPSGNTFNLTTFTITSSFVVNNLPGANGNLSAATIDYEEMQSLTIDAGGPTTFNVNGDSTATYLNGGIGLDTFNVNSNVESLFLTSGIGNDAYVINGNAGALTVTGYISGDPGTNSVTINGNSGPLTVNGGPNGDLFVIDGNSGGLTINGGSGNDSFTVNALSAPATLNGNGGINTFTVSTPLSAVLTINGGTTTGTTSGDWLIVNGTTGNDSITVTPGVVSGLGSNINYSGTNLRVNGLSGNDTFQVNGTSAFITKIYGGTYGTDTFNVQANTGALYLTGGSTGNNTFNLGSLAPFTGGVLANLLGQIFITGGTSSMRLITLGAPGINTVNFDDTGDSGAPSGTLTSSTLTGLGMGGGVTFVSINFMNIKLGSGNDIFNVQSTNSTTLTNLWTGTGADIVNIGSLMPTTGGIVDGVKGALYIYGAGADTMNVDDTGSTGPKTGTLTATTLTGLNMGPWGITYSGFSVMNISLGSGGNTFTIVNTTATTVTTLNSGIGNDTINVLADSDTTTINTQSGNDTVNIQTTNATTNVNTGTGADIINIGSLMPTTGGILNGIQGTINVTGDGGDTMNLDDTGSSAVKTGTLTSSTITGLGMGSGGINYSGLSHLNITLGSGNDTFNIQSTYSATATTVNTGLGADIVNIGSLMPATGGNVNGIQGALTVIGNGSDTMNVDDTGSVTAKTGAMTYNTITGLGMGAGGITYSGLATLNISLGSHGNTFTIYSTYVSTTTNLNSGAGNDTVNVQTTSGVTNVNTGAGVNTVNIGSLAPTTGGILNGIQGALTVVGAGTDTMNVDDTGSTGTKTGTLTANTITGLGMGSGGITYSGLATLKISLGSGGNTFTIVNTNSGTTTNVNTGSGNDTVNVRATSSVTTVNTGMGTNTVNIGSMMPTTGGVLNNIQGALTVVGSGTDTMNVDDTGSTGAKTGTLTGISLTGLGMGPSGITYSGLATLKISLGSGGNTFTINNTNSNTTTTLNSGTGSDTVNLKTDSGTTIINTQTGTDTVNVTNDTATTTINTGGGNDTVNIQATHATTNINNSAGADTINIGSLMPVTGGTVNNIQGTINVAGDAIDTMNVDDTGSTTAKTGTLTSSTLTGLGMGSGGINYNGLSVLNISLGSHGNTFTISNTSAGATTTLNSGTGSDTIYVTTDSGTTIINTQTGTDTVNVANDTATTTINTGGGNDTVNIQATHGTTNVNNSTGADTINIGSLMPTTGGTVNNIQGTINVTGDGSDTMNVDDTGSLTGKTGTLTSSALTGLGMSSGGINYSGLTALNISLGNQVNTFTIVNTSTGTTTILNSGNGNDTINVRATSSATTVNTDLGATTVNVGSLMPTTGGILNNIQGALMLIGNGNDTMNVDDTGSIGPKTGTLTPSTITGLGIGTSGISYSGFSTMTISLGSGGNTFTITNTITGMTTLNSGTGSDTVNLMTDSGTTVINTQTGADTVNVINDTATTTINTGGGNDTVNIQATHATTNVNNSAGADTINIGSLMPTTGGTVNNIQGTIDVAGDGSDTMNVDDTGSTAAKTGTLTSSALTGLGMAGINYSGLSALNMSLGSGGNTFTITNTSAGTTTTLNSGTGSDTVSVTTDSSTTIINTQTGTDTVNVANDTGTTTINTGGGNDTVNIQTTNATTSVNNSAGADTINIGSNEPSSNGTISNIQGAINVTGDGSDTMNVDDTGSTASKTGTLTSIALTGLGMAGINYSGLTALNISLSSGGDVLLIASTSSATTHINGGNGNDTFNVRATTGSLYLNGNAGNNTYNFGSLEPGTGGVVSGIAGAVYISGQNSLMRLLNLSSGTNVVNVDDSGDGTAYSGLLTSSTLTGLGMGVGITFVSITTMNINLGSGNDTFNIQSINSTTVTAVNTGLGADTVNIGSLAPATGGTLNNILDTLTVTGGGNDTMNVDDTAITTPISGSLTSSILIVGLGGGAITINYSGLSALNISLGGGGNTFTISNTSAGTTTTLNSGTGSDTINLTTDSGPTIINTQAGNDTVNVTNDTATTTVNMGNGNDTVNLTNDGATTNITMGNGSDLVNVTNDGATTTVSLGSGTDTVNLGNDTGATTITTGGGNDTINIQATNATTNVNNSAGTDTINIGSLMPTIGGTVNNIQGTINVNGSGSDALNVDDTGSTAAKTGTLTSSSITGLGMGSGGITYSGMSALNISLGSGGNTFTIASTITGTTILNTGSGNDTVNVQSTNGATTVNTGAGTNTVNVGSLMPTTGGVVNNIQGAVTVIGSGSDTMNVDDTGSTAANSETLTATTLTGLGMGASGITYSGLSVLNISLGSGTDALTVTGVTNTTVTTINGNGGTNTATLNFSGDFGGNLTLLNFATATLTVGGNFTGQLTDAGAVTPVAIIGSLTSTGALNAGSIATMTVGGSLAGSLSVTGLLGTLTVTGGTSGVITVGSVNLINVLAGSGNTLLNLTSGGIQREILATPVAGGTMPNTVTFQFVYDATTATVPQVAIQITNTSPVARSFNLALVVTNSATAKFDLSILDSKSNAATGLSNISLQGDLLEGLTAPELLVFTNLNASSRGGIVLPADSITGLEVSNILPIGFVNVAGIEGVAFAILTTAGGTPVTVTSPFGSASNIQVLWNYLGSTPTLNPANDAFVFSFNQTQSVRLFAHVDNNPDMELVMTLTAETTGNLPIMASVQMISTTNSASPLVQSVVLTGAGGSINSAYSIANITSTGALGDVTITASAGSTVNNEPGLGNVTAPSIFGSINVTNAGIWGVIQTTSGDIGQTILGTGTTITGVTTITSNGALTGQIISRGNLISSVRTNSSFSGVIAAQGNIGVIQTSNGNAVLTGNSLTRFGGINVAGADSGQIIALGNVFGDLTVSGSLTGRIAAKGAAVAGLAASRMGILGNITATTDAVGSAIISGGLIGDAVGGTTANLGSAKGFVAADGAITLSSTTTIAANNELQNVTGANLSALNAIFTNNNASLLFDTGGTLQGLVLIETDLMNIQDNSGVLSGTVL